MRAVLLILSVSLVNAIPVDNGVEGEPEVSFKLNSIKVCVKIECGATGITVNFNTRNPFEGHVYVKGLFDQASCRNEEHGRQVFSPAGPDLTMF